VGQPRQPLGALLAIPSPDLRHFLPSGSTAVKEEKERYRHLESGQPLVTSAEVLQELLHAYLPVGRMNTLDAAMELARSLVVRHPGLGARAPLHLASIIRRGVSGVKTFDRALGAAVSGIG
jgi:predicted nucleic acid-binding protein